MPRPLRVVHVGLGPIGQGIARLVLETEGLKLVGAADVSKDKAGKDLGVVLGLPKKLRVKVAGDLGRFLRKSRADVAILSTSSSLREVKPLVAAVVQRGMNVVTTCEELVFPAPARQSAFRELERLARAKRVSVLGAGVNPGFAMDALALMLKVLGNKMGFFGAGPVVKPAALTAQLTTLTFVAPGVADYDLAAPVQNTGWGFSTADEFKTAMSVIANLQTRLGQLETRQQGLGLLS